MSKKVSLLQFALAEKARDIKDYEYVTVGVFTDNVEEGLDSDDVAMGHFHIAREKEPWKGKIISYRCFEVELNSVLSFEED